MDTYIKKILLIIILIKKLKVIKLVLLEIIMMDRKDPPDVQSLPNHHLINHSGQEELANNLEASTKQIGY